MTTLSYSSADHLALLPPLLLSLFACATMLLDVAARYAEQAKRGVMGFGLVGLALTGYALFLQWRAIDNAGQPFITALQDSVTVDGLSLFTNGVVLVATAILFLSAYRYLEISDEHRPEFYCLALFAFCGMYFMASAVDLIVLFVGLETAAVSFYILVGFTRTDRRSNEAALKYLLLGALASGFVVYGFSLLYGISGSTRLTEIAAAVVERGPRDPFVILATVTITTGLLFKISAVPFHTWAPDAYDGAPTPVTAYLSVASKVASFAVLIRLLLMTLPAARPIWGPMIVVASVASLTIGSIATLNQSRLKRFFAYSSIAHVGYVLLGFVANTPAGLKGVYVYLLVYAVMNLGAFTLLISLRRHGITGEWISDLRGLSKNHPVHAALFVVLLLSLAGMPPTAGFLAKYFIFVALIETGHITLAVIAAAYTAVSLYFYFRLVREMYLSDGEVAEPIEASLGVRISLAVTTAFTLLVGLFPEPLLRAGIRLTGGGQ
jgi:NADH-quinone oxidoreductase subunit N